MKVTSRIKTILDDKRVKYFFRLFISIGILFFLVYFIAANKDKYRELIHISSTNVLILILLAVPFQLLNAIQNTYLYRSLGVKDFSFRDGYLITSAASLANQLPLPGGIVAKGYYLKNNYNLSYTLFTSSTIAAFVVFVAVNGITGLTVLLFWQFFSGSLIPVSLYILFSCMVLPLILFWLPLEKIKLPRMFHRFSDQVFQGWSVIGRNLPLLIRLSVLQVLLIIILALRYLAAFQMLSQNINFGQSILFASSSILTQLVTIAPGGLGVREAIVASVGAVLGFDIAVSVICTGIDRLFSTLVIVINGWICMLLLRKK